MTDLTVSCTMTLMEDDGALLSHIEQNAKHVKRTISPFPVKEGKTLDICGAGPSLNLYNEDVIPADEVWACNSALPYLMEDGARVTHAIAIDHSLGMLEDWKQTYDVEYLVASSIHPDLTAHLLKHKRRLRWFHNYLGLKSPKGWKVPANYRRQFIKAGYSRKEYKWTKEIFLYDTMFPPSNMPQYGLNVAARALCMAVRLGFSTIRLWGADCAGALKGSTPMPELDQTNPSQDWVDWFKANRMPDANSPEYPAWLERLTMYADGRNALQAYGPTCSIVQSPLLNGRHYFTRADMMVTAEHITYIVRTDPIQGRIQLMGDTLPGAMLSQAPEFWEHPTHKAPQLNGKGAIEGFRMTPESHALVEQRRALVTTERTI